MSSPISPLGHTRPTHIATVDNECFSVHRSRAGAALGFFDDILDAMTFSKKVGVGSYVKRLSDGAICAQRVGGNITTYMVDLGLTSSL